MNAAWATVQLGDILTERRETPSDIELLTGDIRIVDKVSFNDGRIHLRQSQDTKTEMILVRLGDILVSGINAAKGAIALHEEGPAPLAATIHYGAYQADPSRVSTKYLWWLLRSNFFRNLLSTYVPGGIKTELKSKRLLPIPVPLPPLAEQRSIVARIEELATKVEEARRLRSLAFDEAEALLRSAIDSIYKRLTSEIGLSRLGAACTSITDGDHLTPAFSEGGVKFIFVGNVSTGRLHFKGVKYVTAQYFQGLSATRVPRRDDLLYSAVGATLGIPAVVDVDDDFCFQRHVAILKPDHTKVLSRFLWHMLKSQTVFDKGWASTTGSAQPTIPLRAIRELPIPLPPLDRQKQVVAQLDALQAKVDAVKALQTKTAAELDAMLPAILDKAFKGEL